jgi:hypothetical protein
MAGDLQAFRERAARAVAKVARGSTADHADHYARMADAVIAEFAKPTNAMIDAAYKAVRFDEAWAINSRARLCQSSERDGPNNAEQALLNRQIRSRPLKHFHGLQNRWNPRCRVESMRRLR